MITNQEYKLLQKENEQLQKELEEYKKKMVYWRDAFNDETIKMEQVKKERDELRMYRKNDKSLFDNTMKCLKETEKELEGITAERDHYRVGVNNLTKERNELKKLKGRMLKECWDCNLDLEEEEEEREQSYSLEEIKEAFKRAKKQSYQMYKVELPAFINELLKSKQSDHKADTSPCPECGYRYSNDDMVNHLLYVHPNADHRDKEEKESPIYYGEGWIWFPGELYPISAQIQVKKKDTKIDKDKERQRKWTEVNGEAPDIS